MTFSLKFTVMLAVTFLLIANPALGAVGDVGISDTALDVGQDASSLAGIATDSYVAEQSGQAPVSQQLLSSSSSVPSGSYPAQGQTGYLNQQSSSSSGSAPSGSYPAQGQTGYQDQQSAYPAPQISGPVQEQMTAEKLGLAQPQMESYAPDGNLGFTSASQPDDATQMMPSAMPSSAQPNAAYSASYPVQSTETGSSTWYYPSSLVSANKFYVQTASGLRSIGGCSYRGYLPLWADIKSSGNFYVYEWYPGRSTPSVRWWGWTGSGWKKGWFFGDVSGWHILCYNSGIWSNYIYIYVYPAGAVMSAPSAYSNAAPGMSATSLPQGAPVPPDPAAEGVALPDYSLYRPIADQSYQSGYSYTNYPARGSTQFTSRLAATNPALANSPNPAAVAGTAVLPGQASASSKTCTTCTSSTIVTGGVSSIYPDSTGCPTCAPIASQSAPYGYAAQSYQAVYPMPSTCRCNEYYVQSCAGKLATVAGVFNGQWLPLWSKVSRPGVYWSFEWTACSGPSYYCQPEFKNFGYKSTGWYQTWFKANNPGWHILSYCCHDWSNYIYIYVWPAD